MEFLAAQTGMEAWEWGMLFFCALLIGMSKTGIQGINTVSIPIMALIFGAKESTGIILPMLCFADLLAVLYYRRSCEWKYVLKLLPAAVVGFFLAIGAEKFIDADGFRRLMALCIFAGLFVMLWNAGKGRQERARSLSSSWSYAAAFGVLGGFSTMIGNAAGPIMAVYLLGARLPKLAFVGTNAWFFLVVNYLKIPLQVFAWDNISTDTLALNLCAAPFIVIGALAGILFVKKTPGAKLQNLHHRRDSPLNPPAVLLSDGFLHSRLHTQFGYPPSKWQEYFKIPK